MIQFFQIPDNLRLPGTFIEFDSSLAGSQELQQKVLVIGQRLTAGSVAQGIAKRIYDPSQADDFWGRGSMMAEQFRYLKQANPYIETWGIALNEDAAGVAATGKITVAAGTADENGTIYLYIAGQRIKVAVALDDDQDDIAAAIIAAINAVDTLPVTALVDGVDANEVNLTCRWKGETGNTLDVRLNYFEGEVLPAGVALTITAMSGGTTNPDITTAIAAMGDEWYNWIVMPFTDAANMTALEAELDSRYGPMRQIGARAFCAFRGDLSATNTFGDGRNSPHVTCVGTNIAPEPPYLWASVNAVQAAASLARDPARQLRTIQFTGLKSPAREVRWEGTERNTLLFDGISTYTVDANGVPRIESQITMYQVNALDIADTSYLYINVPETLDRIRYEQIAMMQSKYAIAKLATDEDGPFGPDDLVMQPRLAKSEYITLYQTFVERGWCVDLEGYKTTIVAEIDEENTSQLNMLDSPKIIGNYIVHKQRTQFRS
jgi:phage tail sheath gpL-like